MTNNYKRNHNLPTKRYCGYHKKRERQKERERFNKYFTPVIEECIRNIFPSKEDWKMEFVDYKQGNKLKRTNCINKFR